MTTPTPGSAGDPQQHESASSTDPTREIEVDRPTEEQPSAHTRVFGTEEAGAHQHAAPKAWDSPAAPQQHAHTGQHEQHQQALPEPPAPLERPSGPHLPPVLLGIVCLAIAGLAIWQEVTDVQVDWGNVGPLGIVAIGALLVLLGVVGLLGSRRRSRTS